MLLPMLLCEYIRRMDIDVEGHELKILESLDFQQVQIDIISVENNKGKYTQFLESRGYKRWAKVHYDVFYIHNRVELPSLAVEALAKQDEWQCLRAES